MQPQPNDSDFVILWYLALTLTMFVLVSSKAFEYFAIYRRQRELEERLEKLEQESLFLDRYNSHRISELEHD
jgi:hypothetical protein